MMSLEKTSLKGIDNPYLVTVKPPKMGWRGGWVKRDRILSIVVQEVIVSATNKIKGNEEIKIDPGLVWDDSASLTRGGMVVKLAFDVCV